MREIFSEPATVARYVEVEVALAQVEARLGIIPQDAADSIRRLASAKDIDLAQLRLATNVVGYPSSGLVAQLAKQCGAAGRYLRWGATTQDIMDTAIVLQIKAALAIVERDLAAIDGALAELAKTFRGTVMAGRTHLQHALPITVGYKAAVWLSAVLRHRPAAGRDQAAPLGRAVRPARQVRWLRWATKGLAVHDALMGELGLGSAAMPWHVGRDKRGGSRRAAGLDRRQHWPRSQPTSC